MIIKLFEILNSFVSLFEKLCRLRFVLLWDLIIEGLCQITSFILPFIPSIRP
jgi:hypothetical protein